MREIHLSTDPVMLDSQKLVIPAQPGIQARHNKLKTLDYRFHKNDGDVSCHTFYENVSDNEHNQAVDLKEFLEEKKDFVHNEAADLIKNQSQVYKTKQENSDLNPCELTMKVQDNGTKRNNRQFPDPKFFTPKIDCRFYEGI